MTEPQFPADGILWHTWSEVTERKIAEKGRPVLLFVADGDPVVWPFLRELYKALPANARLRELLHDRFIALFCKAGEIPEEIAVYGAGSRYHLAVLSPSGFNPLVTFAVQRGDPVKVVEEIVAVLENLLETWQ